MKGTSKQQRAVNLCALAEEMMLLTLERVSKLGVTVQAGQGDRYAKIILKFGNLYYHHPEK